MPCTWVTPAATAVSVFATAQAVSSWQWMPSRAPVAGATAATTSPSSLGSIPPLVSQSATTSAPASAATRTTSRAYAGLERYPSKKCSASRNTRWPSAARCRTVSAIMARFSASVVRSAAVTCRSWLLATSVTTGAPESRNAATCGSSAVTAPGRRVDPNAARVAWLS